MDYIILHITHVIVGFILLLMAVRSYLKTRISSMLYFILGFFFLAFGHLIADIYFFNDLSMYILIVELFDTAGLFALLIGVIGYD
jgi:uncharacterized membrane protein